MILHVVGARPNFMKLAPLYHELARNNFEQQVIHTGQHFDTEMSEVFFTDLGMERPEYNLGISSGSPIKQISLMMPALEEAFLMEKPSLVFVYGDVNSSLAGALVADKLQIKLAHVEAGLRSYDRTMPEEGNRLIIDHLSDLLFAPSADAVANLVGEGIQESKIFFVGNIMIDSLKMMVEKILDEKEPSNHFGEFGLVTLHRPSNVDNPNKLKEIINELKVISEKIKLVWPMHPRTRQQMVKLNYRNDAKNMELVDPKGYKDFLKLQLNAKFLITDSGGIQEETTYLGIPCFTLRNNTERPITISLGTNNLIGENYNKIHQLVNEILNGTVREYQVPPLWDGNTANRIVTVVKSLF